MFVSKVESGSGSEKAGLRVGDQVKRHLGTAILSIQRGFTLFRDTEFSRRVSFIGRLSTLVRFLYWSWRLNYLSPLNRHLL